MQGIATRRLRTKRVLPGFGLTMGTTLLFISLVMLLPLSALLMEVGSLSAAEFWQIISAERAVATYILTGSSALAAALFNCVFGVLEIGRASCRESAVMSGGGGRV